MTMSLRQAATASTMPSMLRRHTPALCAVFVMAKQRAQRRPCIMRQPRRREWCRTCDHDIDMDMERPRCVTSGATRRCEGSGEQHASRLIFNAPNHHYAFESHGTETAVTLLLRSCAPRPLMWSATPILATSWASSNSSSAGRPSSGVAGHVPRTDDSATSTSASTVSATAAFASVSATTISEDAVRAANFRRRLCQHSLSRHNHCYRLRRLQTEVDAAGRVERRVRSRRDVDI